MAHPNRIHLVIPTPYAWSAEGNVSDRVEIVLTPSAGATFNFKTIGTVANDPPLEKYNQWYWQFSGDLQAQITWNIDGNQIDSGQKTIRVNASLELVLPESGGPDKLLRGSLSLPVDSFDQASWQDRLQKLWPTANLADIKQLRIEPTGLFVLGNLPEAFFPDGTSNTQVVLRVPQQEKDQAKDQNAVKTIFRWNGDLSTQRIETATPTTRLWTLLPFQFRDELAGEFTLINQDAATLIRKYVAALHIETPGQQTQTFLDNVECEPAPECKIFLTTTPEEISWWAEGIGVRLMIAAPQTSESLQGRPEATFYPEFLTGSLTRDAGDTWQQQPIAFVAGVSDPNERSRELIQLDITLPQTLSFKFTARDLAAIAIPATLLQDAKGLLKVASIKVNDVTTGKTKDIQKIIQRVWLCVETGWLSLDTLQPQLQLKVDQTQSSSAVTSVLPLSQIVGAFNPSPDTEVLAGMDIQVEALSNSFVAIVLKISETEPLLSLWIEHPKVILQTPRVWYQAPNTDEKVQSSEAPIDDQPRTQRPVLETLIPSLTTLTDLSNGKEVQLEERLHQILLSATFISKNALEELPEQPGQPDKVGIPQALQVSVSFDSVANKFVFSWKNSKGMRLWQYSEGYPLIQTVPLSPAASRDRFLDANRGLIPYEKLEPNEKVIIEFPESGLAKLDRKPDGVDFKSNSWQVSPEFSNQRFFLPTLPGVELQQAKPEAGEQKKQWDWFYRHAVPALDEAYTEVVETSKEGDDPKSTVPVELTLVREAEAFKLFPETDNDKQAKGWLPKTPQNIEGVTPIEIQQVNLKGRYPELKFELNGIDEPFIFQRPKFLDDSASSALTQKLQVSLRDDEANPPQFQVTWKKNNDDPNAPSIVNNGQPLIALWNEVRQRVMTLDAEGVLREEPSGATVREWPVNQLPRLLRSETYELQDQNDSGTTLQLDIAGIVLADAENSNPEQERGQWMLHDGRGSWPVWRGFCLFPTKLLEIGQTDATLTIKLEAIVLWQTKNDLEKISSEQLSQLAATSVGRITLTFVGVDSNPIPPGPVINSSFKLETVIGTIDWRFSHLPEEQTEASAEQEEGTVKLLRIKAEFKDNSAELELPMSLQEVDLKHSIGLLRLKPDNELLETTCKFAKGLLSFTAKRETTEFAYTLPFTELKPESILKIPQALPEGWTFSWMNPLVGNSPRWKLSHTSQSNWQFRLEQDEVDLTGDLKLRLNQVGPRQFMFQVMGIDQSTTPNPLEQSWFRIDDSAPEGGFVGIEFAPPDDPSDAQAPELKVSDIATEIQICFSDRKPSTNDSVHLYDPKQDELESIDQGTSIIQELQPNLGTDEEPDLRAFPGVGAIALGEQIFWCTSDGKVQRWDRNKNEVDQSIQSSATTSIKIESPSDLEQDFKATFLCPFEDSQSQVLAIGNQNQNENQLLVFWDLNDPNQRPTGLPLIVDQPSPEFGDFLALANNRRRESGAARVIAWSRKVKSDADKYHLRVWIPDDSPTPPTSSPSLPHESNIIAIDWEPTKNWLVTGDQDGKIVIFDPKASSANISQILIQKSVPVTALAVISTDISSSRFIVSGGPDGRVRLWAEPPLNMPTGTDPVPENETPIDTYSMLAGVKKLVPLSNSELAVLDEDGTVVILTIYTPETGKQSKARFVTELNNPFIDGSKLPRILSFSSAEIRSIDWLSARRSLLAIGKPPRTRLVGLLRLKKQAKELDISLTATGWWVVENELTFFERVEVPGTINKRKCFHRIRVFLDQATLPLDAVYKGIGPRSKDEFFAAIVEHTLRLSVGKKVLMIDNQLNPFQQVERNWQTTQLLRLTTLERFRQTFGNPLDDANKDKLVLEAGAVFWLRWMKPDLERRRGASEIYHPALRIFLRPQKAGRFQAIQNETDCLHLVRLPFASTLQKLISKTLSIPDLDNNQADDQICHDSTGVQPALLTLPEDNLPNQVAYFRRTSPLSPSLLRTSSKIQVTNFDALWLQESFLKKVLCPETVAGLPEGQISPVLDGQLKDLDWLRLPPTRASDTGLNPGNIEKRRQQQVLVAATLTRYLDDSASSLFEFPFQVLGSDKLPRLSTADEAFQEPTKPLETSYDLTLCNVQLVAFVEGKFVCLAREQLEISAEKLIQQMGGNPDEAKKQLEAEIEALKPAYRKGQIKQLLDLLSVSLPEAPTLAQQVKYLILTWAKNILATRRRSYGAFVLVDFSQVLLVPLSPEAFREELRYAQPWLGQTLQIDPRSRFPRVVPATENPVTGHQPLVQLIPNPDLNLLLFAADPVPPTPPQPTIAATYFRLAPTGPAQWSREKLTRLFTGILRPAQRASAQVVKVGTSESKRMMIQPGDLPGNLLGTTMQEDIPFEQYDTKIFPRPDTRTRTERPVVYWEVPAEKEEAETTSIETVLPPLIDVMSWAARPGELTRTSWNIENIQYESDHIKIGVAPETSATLRRPRAIAGQNQSVRLTLKETEKLNPQRLDGKRFCYTQLELQQVLDRTGSNNFPKQGIYAVLATRNEIFRSFISPDRAQQSPGLVYFAGTQFAQATLEDFTLYLFADSRFQPKSDTSRTRLLWTLNPNDLTEIPKDAFDSTADGVILADINSPNDVGSGWTSLSGSISQYEVAFSMLLEKIPEPANEPVYLAVVHYTLVEAPPGGGTPTDGEPPEDKFVPELWSTIAVYFLSNQGRLRAPKLSISVLAAPQDTPESVILAGYGRLSNSEFSPIRPNAGESQQIEWSRSASLEVLHRVNNPANPSSYDYDVVVYGSGGEVLTTEQTTNERGSVVNARA